MSTDIEKAFDDAIEKATAEGRHVVAIALKQQRYARTHRTDNQGRVHDIDPDTGLDVGTVAADGPGTAEPELPTYGEISQGAFAVAPPPTFAQQVADATAAGNHLLAIQLKQDAAYAQLRDQNPRNR